MSIFEALKGSKSANKTLDYCESEYIIDPETGEKKEKCILKSGVNCDIADIREDFAETRNHFNKNEGRQAMHFVLSFHPNELPNTTNNQEKCLEIGMELANRIGQGHESGCFIHADQEHLHCHIVLNSVNYETGKKFQMKKDQDLVLFRNISDQVCKEYAIEPLEAYKGENVREKNAEKRIKERGGKTWKDDVREAINYAKQRATDMDSYKELLAEKGIEMFERSQNTKGYIHIAQRDSGAKTYKLRDRNKALDGGYHLEDIMKAFEKNMQLQKTLQEPTERSKKDPTSFISKQPKSTTVVPSIPSIPNVSNDGFDETIQNTRDKKAAIKEKTSTNLKAADDEAKRLEIKKNEQIQLEQAEIDKQIELKKQAEIEEMYRLFTKMFPRSTYKTIENNEEEINLYLGGSTRKRYKISYEKEFNVISINEKNNNGSYQEKSVQILKDSSYDLYESI